MSGTRWFFAGALSLCAMAATSLGWAQQQPVNPEPPIGQQPVVEAAWVEVVLDIPCGDTTTMRKIRSPWGLGNYQLRALYYKKHAGVDLPTKTDVTAQAVWTSSNPSVGDFSSPPGFFYGADYVGGTTVVTASYGGHVSEPFWITLPSGVPFPILSESELCNGNDTQHDADLGQAIDEIIEALKPIGGWPVDPIVPGPPGWSPIDPGNDFIIVEAGPGAGGVGAPSPISVGVYPRGITPDQSPENNGGTEGDLVYLRSNRTASVVGVDAASSYRLRELVDANGGLVFPPDLSFYDQVAAIWCAWCRNNECDESEGGNACGDDKNCQPGDCKPDFIWVYIYNVYGQPSGSGQYGNE